MFNCFMLFLLFAVGLLRLSPAAHALCLPCQNVERAYRSPMLAPRTVYSPKIESPNAETTWQMRSEVTVTWDLSDMPHDITNTQGKIVLGYLDDNSDDEHLDIDHPLADGFDIRQGHVTVQVPQVDPRSNYIIVLFGDSGNRSPKFTIN